MSGVTDPSSFAPSFLRSRLRVLECARAEMGHFVCVMRGYVFTEVVDSAWTKLQLHLRRADSWMELRRMHEEYIQHIHKGCFRTTNKETTDGVNATTTTTASDHAASVLSSAIDKIFASIIDFQCRLARIDLRHRIPTTDWMAILSARDRYRNYVAFMVNIMQHQVAPVTTKRQSAMTSTVSDAHHLLNRLDFNRFYRDREATAKEMENNNKRKA